MWLNLNFKNILKSGTYDTTHIFFENSDICIYYHFGATTLKQVMIKIKLLIVIGIA